MKVHHETEGCQLVFFLGKTDSLRTYDLIGFMSLRVYIDYHFGYSVVSAHAVCFTMCRRYIIISSQ